MFIDDMCSYYYTPDDIRYVTTYDIYNMCLYYCTPDVFILYICIYNIFIYTLYASKLYDLTREARRLKRRFLRVDIDFKSAFNSMSQSSLWTILEAYGIPDVDLL